MTVLSEICRGKRGSGRHLFTCFEQIAHITVYVLHIGPAYAYCPHFSPFTQVLFLGHNFSRFSVVVVVVFAVYLLLKMFSRFASVFPHLHMFC